MFKKKEKEKKNNLSFSSKPKDTRILSFQADCYTIKSDIR